MMKNQPCLAGAGHRIPLLSAGAALWTAGLLVATPFLSAGQTQLQSSPPHPDSVVAAVAATQGLPSVSAAEQLPVGTYWVVHNSLPCVTAPLPCPPADPNTVVYAIGGGQFLADEAAGPLISPLPLLYRNRALSTADYAAILQAQADQLQNFVAQMQAAQSNAQSSPNGPMSASDPDSPPMPPWGGSGTNGWPGTGATFNGRLYTTNDLWLQILSMSVTNATANLLIHPPWNVTNGVYDLLYCANVAPPISWQWLLRTDPGQTNLTAPAANPQQGFYRLGPPNDLAATDSLGTNFWLAFPTLVNDGGDVSLYISSAVGATGVVTVPGLGITNAFSVAAGTVTNVDLDPSVMMADYDEVETNGIQITASQPVSVYAVAYSFETTCSFTGYPTTLLGTNYCLMARASMDPYDIYHGNPSSQFAILATVNNTTVHITPSPTADLEGHTNAYTVTNLQQGETYQINSSNIMGDVTGTWITSDQPLAVFAGASIAYVPDEYTYAGNPLVQEQSPVDTWGAQALGLSFAGRLYGDSYRVLAAYSNTVVTVTTTSGVIVVTNQAGQFYDIAVEGPVEFQASQPIQVAQFANGLDFDDEVGDPCEILLPPAGHYLPTNIVFTLPDDLITGDFYQNYLTIIVPQSALTNTWVDGATVDASNFVSIGTSGYYGAQITVTNSGVHTVTSSQPVGVQAYGFGTTDAYGCFGGLVK